MRKIFSLLFIIPLTLFSQEVDIDSLFKNRGVLYFSFPVESQQELNKFSRIVSLDHGSTVSDVKAYANRTEFGKFLTYNKSYTILQEERVHPDSLNMLLNLSERSSNSWDFYPSYDVYVEMMYNFQEDYPDLCRVSTFGYSEEGRELIIAKLGDDVDEEEGEPRLLYTSSMHGDEIAGYVLSLRLIDYLLSNYESNDRVNNLMQSVEIWINPLANPDGAYMGGNNTVSAAQRHNANWVDLNRNYPDPEDGLHPDGNPYQSETLAFMELADSCEFDISSNFHGGVEVANYPWDTWDNDPADLDWWLHVMYGFADTAHYYGWDGFFDYTPSGIINGYDWYEVNGGRQDYMNHEHRCREFTLEISDQKTPSASHLPYYWDASYRSFMAYIEQSTYGLHGVVSDSITGEPLKAKVYIDGHDIDSSHVYSHLPKGDYHRYLYSGTYDVTFSSEGYTSKTITVDIVNNQQTYLDVQLGTLEVGLLEASLDFDIHPQPANEYITLTIDGPYEYSILDIKGAVVKSQMYGNHRIIDISSLEQGTYIFNVIIEGTIFSKEFIKK